ncbi:pro-neuregulin-4, membrane-bound isoform [Gastrophryne carolinensis]
MTIIRQQAALMPVPCPIFHTEQIHFPGYTTQLRYSICLHNMTTGHGEPCAEREQKTFCKNGGICYTIGSTQLCKCINNYTGQRCEGALLASVEAEHKSDFLINFVVLAFFLALLFFVFIYFYCRRKLKNRTEEEP